MLPIWGVGFKFLVSCIVLWEVSKAVKPNLTLGF